MPELRKTKRDKLRFAAKLLFELPPADTLPVFKRLSVDNVEILLDHLKQDTTEGRGQLNLHRSADEIHCERTTDFFLKRTPEQMCRVLQYESPTTIAKTLSLMTPEAVTDTLKRLPTRTRELTTQAIINLPPLTNDEAFQLQFKLRQKQNRLLDDDPSDSNNQAPAENKPERRDAFHVSNQPIADQADSDANCSLVEMKHFSQQPDSEIRATLKHCDTSVWAPALKNAPVEIKQKIMNCMAPAAVSLLKLEIDKVGLVSTQHEKLAREAILNTASRLATTGQTNSDRGIG